MKQKLLHIVLFCFGLYSFGQTCPSLISPLEGETDVPVDATINWNAADGVPGYQIRLGTAPGLSDIAQASVGSATSYTPPLGMPQNTQIYVTIILDFLFEGGSDIVCPSQSFTTEIVTTVPNCTMINTPADTATDISVFTNITWQYAPTATGYLVSLGTAPGADDLLSNEDVGNRLNYSPVTEFPPETTIYVSIVPYNVIGDALPCLEFSFTTGPVASLPGCTNLISPLSGQNNVPLTPLLEWVPVPGATGYRITIGDTPGGNSVLDNATFFTTSTFVIDFEPNRTFFIIIVPFNDAGDAIGCTEESFSTLLGCGPYLDLNTGELVTLNPEFDFPDVLSFCENEATQTVSGPDNADGYRWYRRDPFGNEDLISEDQNLELLEVGDYTLEAYTTVDQSGQSLECPTRKEFSVVSSEIATIDNLGVETVGQELNVTVEVTGNGDYEYAVDDATGPFQDSNAFTNLVLENHTFYVRDKNGCGTAQEELETDLTLQGFPNFFTPNGDNQNDFWQYVQPANSKEIIFKSIAIYNRYGKFLKQISQDSAGWDGTYLGRPIPAGGMWFKAVDEEDRVYNGYFTLKR